MAKLVCPCSNSNHTDTLEKHFNYKENTMPLISVTGISAVTLVLVRHYYSTSNGKILFGGFIPL